MRGSWPKLLRVGLLRSVYHGHEATRELKQLVQAYDTFQLDTQRVMSRIKAIYRGRGIPTPKDGVYRPSQREQWLEKLTEPGMRQRARWLYAELDQVQLLRKQSRKAVRVEGRHHEAVKLLETIPQLGPVRAAQNRRHRGHAVPIPHDTAVLELQWPGCGDPHERGV